MLIRMPSLLYFKGGKNGRKKSGFQNYRCKGCGKQFQDEYLYFVAERRNKNLVFRMLARGSGIRDIADVLKVSSRCVLGGIAVLCNFGTEAQKAVLSSNTDE